MHEQEQRNRSLGDLPADLACRIGGGVDVDVVAPRQQVRCLSIGQRRRSLRRAGRNIGDRPRNAGIRAGLRRASLVSGGPIRRRVARPNILYPGATRSA